MFTKIPATAEQGQHAYEQMVSRMIGRVDTLAMNERLRDRLGVTDSQLTLIVQELQVVLFPAEFLEPDELEDGGVNGVPGLVPHPQSRGLGAGKVAAAVQHLEEMDADPAEWSAKLVAEFRELRERHAAERVHAAERYAEHATRAARDAGKLVRPPMTPEAFAEGGEVAERIGVVAMMKKAGKTTAAIAKAMNVAKRTVSLDLIDARAVGLL